MNSYDLPFLLAGIPPILGALVMFSVRFVHDPPLESNTTSPIAETTSNGDIKLPNLNSKQGPPSYIEAINGKRTGGKWIGGSLPSNECQHLLSHMYTFDGYSSRSYTYSEP